MNEDIYRAGWLAACTAMLAEVDRTAVDVTERNLDPADVLVVLASRMASRANQRTTA